MTKLTPRQEATVAAFEKVLEDTGIEIEYDDLDVWADDRMENGVYSGRDLLNMIVVYLKKYDDYMDILKVINAFDVTISYDEAKDVLEDQGDVQSAIIELRKLRN